MVFRQQLYGEMMFEQRNVWMAVDLFEESVFNFLAGKVFCMNNSFSGVSSFTSEIQVIIVCCREFDAQFNQFSDMLRSFLDHERNHFTVAETGTGFERVLYVECGTVVSANGGCNASLGPVGIGCTAFFFRDDSYPCMISDMQGKIQPSDAAADDQYIGFDFFFHVW